MPSFFFDFLKIICTFAGDSYRMDTQDISKPNINHFKISLFMKKLFPIVMAFVALALTACGGGSKSVDLKGTTYEGAKFTVTIPDSMTVSAKGEGSIDYVNAKTADDNVRLDATFSDHPCQPADFGKYAENMKSLMLNQMGAKSVGEPQIDGDVMVLRVTFETFIEDNYVAYLGEKAGVAGKLRFPVDQAAKYEGYAKAIAQSVKLK